jgi:hypothetical protein
MCLKFCADAPGVPAIKLDCSGLFRHSDDMASDWRRLASHVTSRRVQLGYRDRRAFAVAAGVTARTLGKLETGRPVGASTLAAVELALQWRPDSARRVLSGADPVLVREPVPELPELSDGERRAVIAMVTALRATERRSA